MTLTTNNKLCQIISSRFIDLLVSERVAKHRLGLTKTKPEDTTQRDLLSVEAKALAQKERQLKTEEEFLIYINEYFHDALFEYAEQKIENGNFLFNEILKIDPNLAKMIDLCLSNAINSKQLAELITANASLKREFLNIVNKPPFRDKKSTRPFQEDVGLALRYVGIENIKVPLIVVIVKQWLPHSTDPFTSFKSALWDYSLATANCMEALAKEAKLSEINAFTLGLLHAFGYGIVLRTYLRLFEKVRLIEMQKAKSSGRSDIEKALDSLEFDGEFASDLILKHGLDVSAALLEQLQLKFSPIAHAMLEINSAEPITNLSPLALSLLQTKAYTQYKHLQKARLIELAEAKAFLSQYRINNEFVNKMKLVNLDKINVVVKAD